ncbi:MAG: hypothetical protein NTZ78_00935 [Candidatus Aureabacteria bacterium]|nr:hypothetical protein [Candidatus Auribacterota bacterium]
MSTTNWPPSSDQEVHPGGPLDIRNEIDKKNLGDALLSSTLQKTPDNFFALLEVYKEKPKAFFFKKFRQEAFEACKHSLATIYGIDCLLIRTTPIIRILVEFVTQAFISDIVQTIGLLRTHRLGVAVVQPPPALMCDMLLDPYSVPQRRALLQLEAQESWLFAFAPNGEHFEPTWFEHSVGQHLILRKEREKADASLAKVNPPSPTFAQAREQYNRTAPPLRSMLFASFEPSDESGSVLVPDPAQFEDDFAGCFHRLCGIPISNWY